MPPGTASATGARRSWSVSRERSKRAGSPENFRANPTILWRTLARQERFSREPPEKRSRDSSTLATVLQRTRAVLRRSVSVKQQSGAKRRSMSRQVVEKAGSARACALLQRAVWGVYPEADPGRSRANCCCIFQGGIDAGEPGGGEPPRRLSGGVGDTTEGRSVEHGDGCIGGGRWTNTPATAAATAEAGDGEAGIGDARDDRDGDRDHGHQRGRRASCRAR